MFGPVLMISSLLWLENIWSFLFFSLAKPTRTKGKKIHSNEILPLQNKLEARVKYLVALKEMRKLVFVRRSCLKPVEGMVVGGDPGEVGQSVDTPAV